jgi:mono/diheme cytochrome c family protein
MRGYALAITVFFTVGAFSFGLVRASLGAAPEPKAPQLQGPGPGVTLGPAAEGWTFSWKPPVDAPDTKEYELQVGLQGARKPLIDLIADKSTYTFKQQLLLPTGSALTLVWKVRAVLSPGTYGPWSEERPFKVEAGKPEPPVTAPPAPSRPRTGPAPAADAGRARIAAGRTVYDANGCARCHSIQGEGGRIGPDLTRVGGDARHTPQWLITHVKNPRTHNRSSRMPSFDGRIGAADLTTLGAYLASLK